MAAAHPICRIHGVMLTRRYSLSTWEPTGSPFCHVCDADSLPQVAQIDHKGRPRGEMTTATGRRINPLELTASDVDVTDIAHALARLCRYNGHVGGFLSVARHSLWVLRRLATTGHAALGLTGLLHDAAEAYLGDVIRPLKHSPQMAAYREIEHRVESAVAERFGLEHPWPQPVSDADTWVLHNVELGGERQRWSWTSAPDADTDEFLDAFDTLTKRADS